MGRQIALLTEVTGRAHQALAEVPLPDAVYDDACRERIFRIDNGVGQFQPLRALGKPLRFTAAENGEKVGRRGLTGIVAAAPDPYPLLYRVGIIGNGLQIGIVRGHLLLEHSKLCAHGLEMRAPDAAEETVQLRISVVIDTFVSE